MSNPEPRAELAGWLDGLVADELVPSYQALVVASGEEIFARVGGAAVLEPERRPATVDTLYDVASLTKPLVTALTALRLAEDAVLPLEMPLARLFDEMCRPPLDRVTVLDLLTHRAGFEPWAPLYLGLKPVLQAYAAAAIARPLAYDPGTDVRYSDLGYLVLGAALERVAGKGFVELARSHVLDPLAKLDARTADNLRLPPVPADRERTAATERGNRFERELAGAAPDATGFREGLIWGSVHDGHAYALGGVGPQAGLFATAAGVARLAREFLPGGALLGGAGRQLAAADLTPFARSRRTAAFELASGPDTGASSVLPPESYGHSGFTGTSVWIEPGRGRIYVLLTNRVHPEVRPQNMNEIRREFHRRASLV